MPHLLYSAKGRDGKPVEGFVEAPSTVEARERLVAQGLADVVLHQDATISTDASRLAGLGAKEQRELARLSISAMARPGLGPLLVEVARGNAIWIAIDVGLIAWGAYTGNWLLLGIGAVLAVLPFGMATWQYRHGGRYNALLKAFAVGDWKRVRDLAEQLRTFSQGVQNMEFDLDVRLAAVRARAGQLREALADIDKWRHRVATPGSFENRIAPLYAAAGDRAGYVRLMGESHALQPNEPARILDYALAEARFGDPGKAAELLNKLDASLLPPHANAFVSWVTGLVQLRQQQGAALDRLGQAVSQFLQLSSQPAAWTALAFCTCDHAIALAVAGRKDEARREVAQVWPILRAHGDKVLLRMLETDGLAPTEQKS